jgi:hypothetical protein
MICAAEFAICSSDDLQAKSPVDQTTVTQGSLLYSLRIDADGARLPSAPHLSP